MLTYIPILCVLFAFITMLCLTIIDLRHRILPNTLNFSLFCLGIAFHTSTDFRFILPLDMLMGTLSGAGILLIIRFVANWAYNDDALGLGDVKLFAAAGVWLGMHYTLLSLIIGAFAGTLHGLGLALHQRIKTGAWPNMNRLSLPAGPGFIVGILIAGAMMLGDFMIGFAS